MAKRTNIVIVLMALLLIGAAPAGQFFPLPDDPNEGIVVPPDSPVKFLRYDKYGRAHFSGRFVLRGAFNYRCNYCEPGTSVGENDLQFSIVPDPALLSRLPHWKAHNNDTMVEIFTRETFHSHDHEYDSSSSAHPRQEGRGNGPHRNRR